MKKYSFAVMTALLMSTVSCVDNSNTENTNTEHSHDDHAGHSHDDHAGHSHDAPTQAAGAIDPVCKMEKTAEWTEYSVSNSDTTWFCSPHCKESFAKNPEKYLSQN